MLQYDGSDFWSGRGSMIIGVLAVGQIEMGGIAVIVGVMRETEDGQVSGVGRRD